jgi:hypothetical protein
MCCSPRPTRERLLRGAPADRAARLPISLVQPGLHVLRGVPRDLHRRKAQEGKRERRRVAEAGIEFDTRLGGDIDDALWETLYELLRRHLLSARPRAVPESGFLQAHAASACRTR